MSLRPMCGVAALAVALSVSALPSTAGAAAAGGAPAPSVQQQAAAPFDVTLVGSKFRVRSGGCRDIPFTVRHNAGYLDRFTAEVEVWRGQDYLGDTFDYVYDSSGPLRASYFWCPFEGVGNLRIGPSLIEYGYDDGSFRDSSRSTLTVLQDVQLGIVSVRRQGTLRTVVARGRFFSVDEYGWRRLPAGTVAHLQRERSDGTWVTVSRARFKRDGKVTLTRRSASAATYRVFTARNTRSWWGATSSFRR